jgi:hypothetical protein
MRVREIALEIARMVEKKNADYGDSFRKTREKFGPIAFLIRLTDKINRLESILNKGTTHFESYEDTIRDIAGYCILELAYVGETDTAEKILRALQGEGYPVEDIKIGGTD